MAEVKESLAATELSSSAAQAIDRGFVLARAIGARFTIMHAVGIDALAPWRELLGERADTVTEKIVEEATGRLAELVSESPVKDDVPVALHIERGVAGTVMPVFAETAGVDLVLIGAHGGASAR